MIFEFSELVLSDVVLVASEEDAAADRMYYFNHSRMAIEITNSSTGKMIIGETY